LWHLTSLDAPTVAVVWALGFAWAAGVRLPLWIPALLALAAWAVYIGDRLLDARAARMAGDVSGLEERHLFHDRHRRVMTPLAVAAALGAAAIVVTLMPSAARERDSVLAVAALAYFTRVHSAGGETASGVSAKFVFAKKEMLVGVLFTAACGLPALSRAGVSGGQLTVTILFALLAWLNCFAIDRWESGDDVGSRHVFAAACGLALVGLVSAAVLVGAEWRCAALVLAGATSALLLAMLDRRRGSMTPLALRSAADLVLLTPLVLIFK
jgi:hypothetical protein